MKFWQSIVGNVGPRLIRLIRRLNGSLLMWRMSQRPKVLPSIVFFLTVANPES